MPRLGRRAGGSSLLVCMSGRWRLGPTFRQHNTSFLFYPRLHIKTSGLGRRRERLWRKESNPAVADPSEREATIVSLVLCFNVAENLRRFTVSQIK